jgi:hypothetical protein
MNEKICLYCNSKLTDKEETICKECYDIDDFLSANIKIPEYQFNFIKDLNLSYDYKSAIFYAMMYKEGIRKINGHDRIAIRDKILWRINNYKNSRDVKIHSSLDGLRY